MADLELGRLVRKLTEFPPYGLWLTWRSDLGTDDKGMWQARMPEDREMDRWGESAEMALLEMLEGLSDE